MNIFKNALFLAFVAISHVHAEDMTPIEIQSSVLSNSVTENKNTVTIIPGVDIESSQSIGTNLRSIPGVSNSDYGTSVGQPVIRGLGGSRVKVLSNNNYVSDLSFFSADHPVMLNINHASHIEVIKGPTSLFNHSGNTGGVVNVVTDSSTNKLYSEEKISFGRSYDTVSEGYSNNFLLKKNINDLAVYISHDKRDYFKYDLSEGSLFEEGTEVHTLNNSDYADKSSTIVLYMIKDWGYFSFSFINNKGTYGIAYHAEEEEEEEEEEGEHRIYSAHKSDTYNFIGRLDNLSFANSLDFSVSNTNAHIKEHEEDGTFKVMNNNSTAYNLKFNFDSVNQERRLLLSYEHAKSPFSSNAYVPKSESFNRSLAYYSESSLSNMNIAYALRYDFNERLTSTKNYEDSAISFSANTAQQINDSLSYNLGFSHVSRSPNMAELFADGKHGPTNRYEKGNSSLEREVSNNIDIGLNFKHGISSIDLSLFRNDIKDFIYLRDLGTTLYDGEHQDADWSQKDAVFQGYEVSYTRPFTLGDRDLYLTLSRDDISAVFDNDTYVPRIPSAKNTLDLTLLGDKNEKYSMSLIYAESQKDFSSIETSTNSYVDLAVKYTNKIRLGDKQDLNVMLYGNNLLDKTRRNHASFVKAHVPLPAASFGFNVSLDYKF
ncbi:MAG: TonB-dependent receptor [Gammaproteobacteria bacterium]